MQNTTLLPPDAPLRKFKIYGNGVGVLDEIEAHEPHFSQTGALVLSQVVGGATFPVRLYAAGVWTAIETAPPTRDAVEKFAAQMDVYEEQVRSLNLQLQLERKRAAQGKPTIKH